MPEDTKDVKIGTLIALMVAEGEDWKSVTAPASEGDSPGAEAAAVAAEAKPAAGGAVAETHAHGYEL